MGKTEIPNAFISFLESVPEFNYTDGYLYRFIKVPKDKLKLIEKANTVKIKSAAKSVQSWTSSLNKAKDFGVARLDANYIRLIIGCYIPSSYIKVRSKDLLEYLKSILPFNYRNHYHRPPEKYDTRYNQELLDVINGIDAFKYEDEYILRISGMVEVDTMYEGYKSYNWEKVGTEMEYPDEVIIVIDDPDTGESHVEIPGQAPNVVPFNRPQEIEEEKAASTK